MMAVLILVCVYVLLFMSIAGLSEEPPFEERTERDKLYDKYMEEL